MRLMALELRLINFLLEKVVYALDCWAFLPYYIEPIKSLAFKHWRCQSLYISVDRWSINSFSCQKNEGAKGHYCMKKKP